MSKEILKTLEIATEINSTLLSNNGFPYYDLMLNSRQRGYVSASNVVFYTENEDILNNFNTLVNKRETTIEDEKQFFLENKKNLMTLQDAKKISTEMRHPLSMAYNHLMSDKEGTIAKAIYGSAHLIVEDKVLIFYQSGLGLDSILRNDSSFEEKYEEIQKKLKKMYDNGDIKPDGEIIEGADKKLINNLNGFFYYQNNEYQKNIGNILKEFKRELTKDINMETSFVNNNLNVEFKLKNSIIKLEIPKEKSEGIRIFQNGAIGIYKDINQLIIEVYKRINEDNINQFVKKIKV
jgi:hypothetical protein